MLKSRLLWCVLLIASLALGACDVIFNLEPLPTEIPTLAPPPPSNTPPPPSPSPQAFQGALTGRVWRDVCPVGSEATPLCKTTATGIFQGNGQFEDGEAPFSGIAVNLGAGQCPASGLAVVRTDNAGIFRFDDVGPGTYCVSIDPTENPSLASGGWTYPEIADKRGRAEQLAAASAGEVTGNVNFGWDDSLPPTPTHTPTPTITLTPTNTGTPTRTGAPTRTRTLAPPTASATRTVTRTSTITLTPTLTLTPTVTTTRSPTPTFTNTLVTPSLTPSITTTPTRGVALSPATAAQFGNAGAVVTYTLTVTNTGAVVDSFNIVIGGTFSGSATPPTISNLAAGASTTVNIGVSIPAGAAGGSTGTTVVTVTSQGDGSKFASANLTTTVIQAGVNVTVAPAVAQTIQAGGTVTYTLTVTNTGNAPDSFSYSTSGAPGAAFTRSITPGSPVGPVAAGSSTTVMVVITLSSTPGTNEQDVVTISFVSQNNSAITALVTLTTTYP